ncbi:MAG: ABC-F family ATP-binding cassette domain-containing protein [Candidatus Nanopelagicales bacterium]
MAIRNLVNFDRVAKAFGERRLLSDVSLGVGEGERIAVVGRNGAGKSTLLNLMAGLETPDSGRVTVNSGVHVGAVSQAESFDPQVTVAEYVVPGQDVHQWASDPSIREIFDGLLGGFDEALLARPLGTMSGGERRRVQLARALIADLDLLLLDEPTNHLDVEVVAWLADHLASRPRLSVVIVTHDRWFLDALCDRTWEVVDGTVEEYDGGYSAFVLSKAERARQEAASEARRQNLLRKELAWLRRGAPARTTKPKFRVDAANELIKGEPAPRDDVQLLAFAGARLGKTVYEFHDVTVAAGERELVDHLTWDVGPGQRVGILGSNGTGKTSLIRTMLGEIPPKAGSITTGVTVKPAYLSQHLEELDPTWRVLEAVERVAARVDLGKDRELTASQLCERLGFGSDGQWTPVGDLSGGERRRLQLTRLLMSGPNVLVLDEPTNDFDVETLTALEDLLDGFAGTLIVISHDRYFLERVCDDFYGLLGGARFTHLTGGVEEYLERVRSRPVSAKSGVAIADAPPKVTAKQQRLDQRALAKEMARIERAIAKLDDTERGLHEQMAEAATDHARLADLNRELQESERRKAELEDEWMRLATDLEG